MVAAYEEIGTGYAVDAKGRPYYVEVLGRFGRSAAPAPEPLLSLVKSVDHPRRAEWPHSPLTGVSLSDGTD